MTRSSNRTLALAAFLLGTTALSGVALADPLPPPPIHNFIDGNGVDLTTGILTIAKTELSIGAAGSGALSYLKYYAGGGGGRDSLIGTITASGSIYTVSVGGASDQFSLSGTTYTSSEGAGSTLTYNSTTEKYTYTSASGVVMIFDKTINSTGSVFAADQGRILSATYPTGESLTYNYLTADYCSDPSTCYLDGYPGPTPIYRLQSVTNNHGYMLHLDYQLNAAQITPTNVSSWNTITKVTGLNLATEYCAPTAVTCTLTNTWPSASFASTVDVNTGVATTTATDVMGRATVYTHSGSQTTIHRPAAPAGQYAATYVTGVGTPVGNMVSSVTTAAGTWNYSYVDAGNVRTTTVTDPKTHQTVATSDLTTGLLSSVKDALNHTTAYTYDTSGRLKKVTAPEGNYWTYNYDARGNVTSTVVTPKAGSGLTAITTSANYAASCTNPVTCNLPTYTKDALGNQTDYTYDSTTGQVKTVTLPAATTGANRPATIYTYASKSAKYYTASGTLTSGPAISVVTDTSQCVTGATCASTSVDRVHTAIDYGTGATANNLAPLSVTSGSGNTSGTGAISATSALTYTIDGDVASVDGPLSGSADSTFFRYNAMREPLGSMGPDPDGTGPLHNRAVRYTRNDDGAVTDVSQGWTNGTTDTSWAGFTALLTRSTTFDTAGRPTKASGAGATVRYGYDGQRLQCVTVRMTSDDTAGVCSQHTGAGDKDRITTYGYDNADRLTSTTRGTGLTETSTDSQTYTNNGQVASVVDGNNNTTNYVYDGFDRLLTVKFPNYSGTSCSTTSGSCEQYTYDASSNVLTDTKRNGIVYTYGYDNIGRLATKSATGITTVTYSYDLLSRPTSVAQAGTMAAVYDDLNRVTSVTAADGKLVSYQYDLAGNRTRLTYPDSASLYVTYEYDNAGELTAMRQNGNTAGVNQLVGLVYNELGQRATMTQGTSKTVSYGYNTLYQLGSLGIDLAGTSADLNITFHYNLAGQIIDRTIDNVNFAQSAPGGQIAGTYAPNTLNQYSSVNGVTQSYDAKGNLASDGTNSFTYDNENRLTKIGSATTLTYDPADRLSRKAGSTDDIRYVYDGSDLIEEYDASTGTVLRKYVHGPGVDEPVVWYEGADLTDRRWMTADERGSVIASTTAPGGVMNINTYDEYGTPGPGNIGRFGYTGQTWLSEGGIYNYKARAYAPRIGRFMQTDPIGYTDNMNAYAYVSNDPIGGLDPSGLQDCGSENRVEPDGTLDVCGSRSECPTGTYASRWSGCITDATEWVEINWQQLFTHAVYTTDGTSNGGAGSPSKPSPYGSCLSNVRSFINAHGADAAVLASQLGNGVSSAEVLATAGKETGWGGGFASMGNYFGLHGHGPAGTYYTTDNHTAVQKFSGQDTFWASGSVFVSNIRPYLTPSMGQNPTAFFTILNQHGYATGNSHYPGDMVRTGSTRGPYTLVKACGG